MVINVDEKSQKLLSEANARLKQAKVKVAIECREESGSLYLRATLPPKPGSRKQSLYQQRIPLRSEQGIGVKITGMTRTIKVVKEDEIDPFTREEMISIIQGFENDPYYTHYTPFVKFLFLTGYRTSEAIGLCWKHIAQDLSFIWFVEAVVEGYRKDTKTKRKRKFPCNESLQSLLDSIHLEEIHPDAPIFPSPKGKLIDSHNFLNRAWTKVLEKQGIRYRCQYQTRHTFITNCIEQGIPIPQIARWVGNSPEVILRHYAGWFDKHEVPVML
jgi:integrase